MEKYRKDLVIVIILYLTDFICLANVLCIGILINMILDMVADKKENK